MTASSVSINIPGMKDPMIIGSAAPAVAGSGDLTGVDANNLGIAQSMEVLIDWYYKPLQDATQSQAYDNLTLQAAQDLVNNVDGWATAVPPGNQLKELADAGISSNLYVQVAARWIDPVFGTQNKTFYVAMDSIKNVPTDYPSQQSLSLNSLYRRADGTYFYTVRGTASSSSTPGGRTGDAGYYEAVVPIGSSGGSIVVPKVAGGTPTANNVRLVATADLAPSLAAWKQAAQGDINTITQNSPSKQNFLQSLLTGFQEFFGFVNTLIQRFANVKSNMISLWTK
jgi:hypothetical protein